MSHTLILHKQFKAFNFLLFIGASARDRCEIIFFFLLQQRFHVHVQHMPTLFNVQSASDVQYVFSFIIIIISFYNNIIWIRNRGVCRRIQLTYLHSIYNFTFKYNKSYSRFYDFQTMMKKLCSLPLV